MRLRPTGLRVKTLDDSRELSLSVSDHDGEVVLQLGDELVKMRPADAQRFGFYLANAYSSCGRWIRPSEDARHRRLVFEEGGSSC